MTDAKKFKLALGAAIAITVEGALNGENDAKPLNYKFVLLCDRLANDELAKAMGDKEESVLTFVERITQGWRNQALVLDDEDKPAEFSVEALRVLLSISGMASECCRAYCTQVVARPL